VRCPYCDTEEDKVVDSRVAEEGKAIRRRRECLSCGRRYTTFERAEEVPMIVRKRDRSEEPFERAKIAEGIRRAAKNRPVTREEIDEIAAGIEEALRAEGRREVGYSDIGRLALERLAALDEVAYLRFASVYKSFQELDDFERELGLLLKRPVAGTDEARTTPAGEATAE
jgi:transcriptional repressor NrdR